MAENTEQTKPEITDIPEQPSSLVTATAITPSVPVKKKRTINRLIIIVIILLAISVIGMIIGYWYMNKNANVAIKVGSITLNKSDYEQLLQQSKEAGYPVLADDTAAKNYIIDTYKLRLAAEKYGYQVTDDGIKEMATSLFNLQDNANSWQLLVAENEAYKVNIAHIKNGDKKMARLVFPFSRYFASGQEQPPKEFGDKALIEADKTYANEQAKQYHEQLAKDQSEALVTKAVASVQSDNKLGYGYAANRNVIFYYNGAGKIYKSLTATETIDNAEKAKLDALGGGVSELYTEVGNKYFSPIEGYNYANVPTAYYFYVLLDKPDAKQSINDDIKNYTDTIKVVSNV